MDKVKLKEMVEKFVQEIPDSPELQTSWTDHQRRSQQAQKLLTVSQIPNLTEEQLREIFFDTDAFRFWTNKDWEFNSRLQKVGLDGLKQLLLELISRAERGLTTDDLKHIWNMKGLGVLLATELLSYRFPLKYWAYNKNVTLLALQELGEDIKAIMPHGQRSNPYLYLAIEPQITEIRQVLSEVGLVDVDNLVADIFLWWISKSAKPKEEIDLVTAIHYWKVSPGKGASAWEEFEKREIIGVHFFDVGDIRLVSPSSIEELKEEIKKSTKATGQALTHATKQLWMFYNDMKIGDLVCAYGRKNIVGWGEIIGDYEYQEDDLIYCHRRKVKWLFNGSISIDSFSPELQEKLQQVKTIIELNDIEFEEIKSAPISVEEETKDNNEPAIIDVDARVIEQAMQDFDANKRGNLEWADWESNQNHKYAILWQEQKYPVKEIVRMATGSSSFTSFQSRPYLQKRGFQIVSLRSGELNDLVQEQEEIAFDRKSEVSARQVIEWIFPDPAIRKYCMEFLADLIVYVNSLAPNKWGITLLKDRLHLNIGKIAFYGPKRKYLWLGIATNNLSQEQRDILIKDFNWDFNNTYKSIPNSTDGNILHEDLEKVLPMLKPHFMELIKRVDRVSGQLGGLMRRAHSPGIISYLRSYLNRDIPDPTYILDEADNEAEAEEEKILNTIDTLELLSSSFTAKGLHFTKQQIATFYTALQTKGFVILSGISGTGKTKLAQHFASLLPQPIEADFSDTAELKSKSSMVSLNKNWLFMSVRPDWRDSKSLLGYYNPLIGNYEWTPFLRFLLRAVDSYQSSDGLAWFVILDEMNLAQVEYYFADILSVIESGREKGWSREPLRFIYPEDAKGSLPPAEIYLPPNLYFVGTVNVDETTHAFSPKVLDRAFTIELTEADFSNYFPNTDGKEVKLDENSQQQILDSFTFNGQFANISKQRIGNYLTSKPQIRLWLQTLNKSLKEYNMHFGYRVFDEIVAFLSSAESNELFEDEGLKGFDSAFDLAILMKVLPKFHGSRGKLESPLCAVLAWCLDPDTPQEETVLDALKQLDIGDDVAEELEKLNYRYPFTAERARRMLRLLYTEGFAAFG